VARSPLTVPIDNGITRMPGRSLIVIFAKRPLIGNEIGLHTRL